MQFRGVRFAVLNGFGPATRNLKSMARSTRTVPDFHTHLWIACQLSTFSRFRQKTKIFSKKCLRYRLLYDFGPPPWPPPLLAPRPPSVPPKRHTGGAGGESRFGCTQCKVNFLMLAAGERFFLKIESWLDMFVFAHCGLCAKVEPGSLQATFCGLLWISGPECDPQGDGLMG
jgi:hypothetical protein